jgi:hypothetical protein
VDLEEQSAAYGMHGDQERLRESEFHLRLGIGRALLACRHRDRSQWRSIGGVRALFKPFTEQAGLRYDVYLETRGGSGLDFHLENKLGVIGQRPWDVVVMHGQSMLDFDKPGDPAKLVLTARQMAEFLHGRNPKGQVHLMATWSRADQTYPPNTASAGKSIEAMGRDVRAAYDKAAVTAGAVSELPVGEARNRAMQTGVADPNPYDGIAPGRVNLWTYDHYHASTQRSCCRNRWRPNAAPRGAEGGVARTGASGG